MDTEQIEKIKKDYDPEVAKELLKNEYYLAGSIEGFTVGASSGRKLGKSEGKKEGFWKGLAAGALLIIGSCCLGQKIKNKKNEESK